MDGTAEWMGCDRVVEARRWRHGLAGDRDSRGDPRQRMWELTGGPDSETGRIGDSTVRCCADRHESSENDAVLEDTRPNDGGLLLIAHSVGPNRVVWQRPHNWADFGCWARCRCSIAAMCTLTPRESISRQRQFECELPAKGATPP
jgi:hypothetical protein